MRHSYLSKVLGGDPGRRPLPEVRQRQTFADLQHHARSVRQGRGGRCGNSHRRRCGLGMAPNSVGHPFLRIHDCLAAGGGTLVVQLATAVALALGIGIQNFPEGLAVAMPLRREGFSRGKSFLYGQASGVVEPIAGEWQMLQESHPHKKESAHSAVWEIPVPAEGKATLTWRVRVKY